MRFRFRSPRRGRALLNVLGLFGLVRKHPRGMFLILLGVSVTVVPSSSMI